MKRLTLLIVACILLSLGQAQQPEAYKLTANDIEHFIKHFPGLKADFEKFGAKYDKESGEFTLPEGVKAMSDFNHIITKHGYKTWEDFITKFTSLIMAYSLVKSETSIQQGQVEIQTQMDEINNNPNLTAEQKQMMKQQMEASMALMQGYAQSYSNSANVAVAKQYVKKLDELFEEE